MKYLTDYETVAASQTAQVLGPAGASGDIVMQVVATVTAADATSAASLLDGATSIPLVPASTPVGVHSISFGASGVRAGTQWKITTGAGVSIIAIGGFS